MGLKCKTCEREYELTTEHGVAVQKRGKCLGCICVANEPIRGAQIPGEMINGVYHYPSDYEFIPEGEPIIPNKD